MSGSPSAPSVGTRAPARALDSIPRPRGRDLDQRELGDFVEELAGRPELWIELIRHDPQQRLYEELIGDVHLSAWLICWMDEHDTGFHDHDVSCGAVAVISGAVREERLVLGGAPVRRTVRAGASFDFAASDIHRVSHFGEDPAVTLHVYSPPLLRMGAYAVGDDGTLERTTVSHTDELRPSAPRV